MRKIDMNKKERIIQYIDQIAPKLEEMSDQIFDLADQLSGDSIL